MRASAVGRSVVPVCCSTLAETTSMGVSELLSVRLFERVPVTITALRFWALPGDGDVAGEVLSCALATVLPSAKSTPIAREAGRKV